MTRLRWIVMLVLAALVVGCGDHDKDKDADRDAKAPVAKQCAEKDADAKDADAKDPDAEDPDARDGDAEKRADHVECPDEVKRELEAPFDAFLTRELSGSDADASPPVAYRRAISAAGALPRNTGDAWSFVGPTNIGGRVLDIALDPKDTNTVYAATSGGGVQKSTDGGKTFAPAWPATYPNAIGAIAITPDGTLYAGTGEAGPGGGALTYGGTGVYRSTDGGATWSSIGLENTTRIGRIVIDPKNPKRIFVAALGNLFKGSTDRGLYRSEDGGDHWTKVLTTDNDTTGVADVAIDPSNPQRMLATAWDAQRTPEQRRYTGAGSGLYRSTDGGSTWTRIGLPLLSNPAIGRMGVAIDPEKPDTVFVNVSGGVGNEIGLFKSTDFGTTLVPTIDPNEYATSGAYTYGWWFGRVWIDPKNSSRIYVAGVGLLKSTDGATTFSVANGEVHSDQHALVFDPRVPGRIWLGNDGGVYRSDDDGGEFTQAKVQPFSQPDSLDVSEQDPTHIVAGLQDNGEIRSYPKVFNPYGPGGDGQAVKINPKDKEIVYGCGQNGACEVSHDGGDSGTAFTNQVVSQRKPFFAPLELDPATPSTVYTGGEILNRSTDDGASWTPISPDLSNGPGTKETNPLYANYGAISALAVAANSSSATGTIYAGTDDGNIQYTHTGGGVANWTKVSDPKLPKAWVTRLTVDPKDDNTVYAAFSGFRSGDKAAYLFRSKDGGKTWADLTGNLPQVPVEDIVLIGGAIVVSDDVGVFSTLDDGKSWFGVGAGLPQVPVYDLRPVAQNTTIYAATFGRSIWKIPFSAATTLPVTVPAVAGTPSKAKKSYLGLPKVRSCRASLSTRLKFKIKPPKPYKAKRATARAGKGKTVRVSGKKLKRYVVVKLPRGKVTVRVTVRTTTGVLLKAQRTYPGCPTKKAKKKAHG